ncbi:MAG: PH domain-containing protein [Candidatus Bathyarchaeia archaeon]|jgi:hypothetical protein
MSSTPAVFPAHHSATSKYYGLIFLLIIAVPIGIILYLTLEGPLIYSVFMFGILLGVLALLSYFVVAGGNTRYELSAKALRVNFGLLRKTVDYTRIDKVEVVNLGLSLRLFGASLPGFHWGLFRTSVGSLHVYATKISGDFVVLTLADGEKLALSPQNPQRLLEALEQNRSLFGRQNPREIESREEALKRILYLQVIAVTAAYLAVLCYFLWVYVSLPQIVPLHFGFDGVPNRFGDKSELLWLAGILVALPVINAVLTLKFGKHERGFVLLLGAIFIVVTAVFFYVIQNIVALA